MALESLMNGGRVLGLTAGTGKLTEAMRRVGVPATAVYSLSIPCPEGAASM